MKKGELENHILDLKVMTAEISVSVKDMRSDQVREIERVDDAIDDIGENTIAIAQGKAGLRVLRWVIALSFGIPGVMYAISRLVG